MEVILLERVEKLGQMGDIVSVRDGFARNFLLPQNKALRATATNKAAFEADKARLEAENLERRNEAEAVAEKMEGLKVVMVRAAGESGQLYGSVTSRDISEAVSEAGVSVARSQVVLDRAIKTLGLHDVVIRLHPEVSKTVVVNIARSMEEAETQFATGSAVTGGIGDEEDFVEEETVEELFEEEAPEEAVEEVAAADEDAEKADA